MKGAVLRLAVGCAVGVLGAASLVGCGEDGRGGQGAPAPNTRTVTNTVTPEPSPRVTVTETETERKTAYRNPDTPRAPVYPGYPPDVESAFVDAYETAGIEAPPDWAVTTAHQVCEAWVAGRDAEHTDQILLEGGIYDHHVREFSDIIELHFCPGLQP